MKINFEMSQQEAEGLINLLGQLPTSSGVFPLLAALVQQFNTQVKPKDDKGETDGDKS